MNETLALIWALAVVAGFLLGALFFGGLWWTVQNTVSAPRSTLWFFGSLLLLMGIALAGLHAVAGGHWQRLAACLLGFVIARGFVTRCTARQVVSLHSPGKEVAHATES